MITLLALSLGSVILILGWHRLVRSDIFDPFLYFLVSYFYLYVFQSLWFQPLLVQEFSEPIVIQGLIWAFAALGAAYWGYCSGLTKRLTLALPILPRRWPPGTLIFYGSILVGLALISQAIFISRSGGAEVFFSKSRGNGDFEQNTAYLYYMKWLIVPGLTFLWAETGFGRLKTNYLKFIGGLSILVFLYQIWMGQRSGILYIGLAVFSAYYLSRKLTPRFLTCVLVGLLLAGTIGFIGKFRREIYYGSDFKKIRMLAQSGVSEQIQEIFVGAAAAGVNSNTPYQLVGFYYLRLKVIPERVGYDLGVGYLNYFVKWIPRLLWPERPDFFAQKARELEEAGVGLKGPVPTMLGEYHANGGPLAIIGLSFLTGLLLGIIEFWRRLYPDNHSVLLGFMMLNRVGWGWVISNGCLGGLDFLLPWIVVPLLVAFIIIKKKTGRLNNRLGHTLVQRRAHAVAKKSFKRVGQPDRL